MFTPVATYADAHGNIVSTAVTQTATGSWDGTAPQLVSVTLADAGNAGAGVGDTITLVYNEALSAASISAALVGANTNNALAAGSGNITGALADIIAELGSFATPTTATASGDDPDPERRRSHGDRHARRHHGDGVFPAGLFTPTASYADAHGNAINTAATQTATGTWDATAPQLVSVTLADAGNAGAGVGDTITLVYNEALSASSISAALVGANTNNALAAGSGNITGALADIIAELGSFATPTTATASAATLTLSADGRTVTITLGGTVADGVFPAGVFTTTASYTDAHGNVINTAVTQTATGTWDGTAPRLVSVTLTDVGNAGAAPGDTITLVYDKALSASSISAALVGADTNNALAAGSGNVTGALADIIAELGSFATPTTATATATVLTLSADGRTVTITLGGTVIDGTFPSGVFTPAATYTDTHGNTVNTAVTQTATGDWGVRPMISSLTTADVDGDGWIDRLVVTFNRNVNPATIVSARFSTDVGSVAGVTNDAPDDPAAIWVNLVDGVLDTGRTPRLSIATDGIRDTFGVPNGAISLHLSVDNARPVILYTLAVAGQSRIAVHFSEAVSHTLAADFTYSGAPSVSSVPTNGTPSYMIVLTGAIPESDITGAVPADDHDQRDGRRCGRPLGGCRRAAATGSRTSGSASSPRSGPGPRKVPERR